MPENEVSSEISSEISNDISNGIPQEVLDQARDAAASGRDAMNAPATAEAVNQPTPDAPADMSNAPDPYDVAGQETYRAEQREAAVADRNAAPEQAPAAQESVETPVGELSQDDYDAMLEAGMALKDSGTRHEIMDATPEAASDAAAPNQPGQDVSVEPTTPEPVGPEIDR